MILSSGGSSVSPTSYQEGDVYFEVTYPDVEMCYPKIQTYVFSGIDNLENGSRVWCFQYAESFVEYGSVFKNAGGDRVVILKTEDELNEMLDISALQSALKDASERRSLKMGDR